MQGAQEKTPGIFLEFGVISNGEGYLLILRQPSQLSEALIRTDAFQVYKV